MFSLKVNLSFSRTTGCIPSIRISIYTFLFVNCYLTVNQCIFVATEIWWAKLEKNSMLVWCVFIFKLGFPRSNCQNFFRQDLNQQLWFYTTWFILDIIFFRPSAENLIGGVCQKLNIWMKPLCIRNNFFQSYRLHVFYRTSIDNFWNLNSFEKWNVEFNCSQWKLGWLRLEKLAYICHSSRYSNFSFQKYRRDFFHQGLR